MKLFVSDLDGTLLNEEHVLDEEMRDYIKELRKEGHIFGIATGRPFYSALNAVPDIKELFDFGVFNNGANFVDFKDEEEHDQFPLSKDLIVNILDVYEPLGANPILFKNGVMYTREETVYHQSMLERGFVIEYVDVRDHLDDYHEKNLFSVNDTTRPIILDHAQDNPHPGYVGFMSQAELVEFMDPRIDKWVGVQYFLNKYNLHHLESISFGDNGNDLELVKGAKVGVAMANAIEEVQSAADHIAPHHNELGVMTFIKNYLK